MSSDLGMGLSQGHYENTRARRKACKIIVAFRAKKNLVLSTKSEVETRHMVIAALRRAACDNTASQTTLQPHKEGQKVNR